ncbi:hypothetical protein M153_37480001, partial [Pseudoloma neurophilia]
PSLEIEKRTLRKYLLYFSKPNIFNLTETYLFNQDINHIVAAMTILLHLKKNNFFVSP